MISQARGIASRARSARSIRAERVRYPSRRWSSSVCQCELVPLFEMSQPALSKHLKVLTGAGVLGAEKRGLWTYYYERPEAREELLKWLS